MQDIFGDQLGNRKKYLQTIIGDKSSALQTAPEGRLRCKRNRDRQEYYWVVERGDSTGNYISKEQQDFARILAQKEYDRKVLQAAEGEFRRIVDLEKYRSKNALASVYDQYNPSRKELVDPLFLPDDEYIEWWIGREHEKLGFEEDATEYYSKKNLRVRSKSEIFIADRLDDYVRPFIYEYPIYLEGRGWTHPDFTILNIRLRKVYIWEHMGRMDDPGYLMDNLSKIRAYERSGYFMGDNLILTFETKNYPLDTREIDRLIEHYLL